MRNSPTLVRSFCYVPDMNLSWLDDIPVDSYTSKHHLHSRSRHSVAALHFWVRCQCSFSAFPSPLTTIYIQCRCVTEYKPRCTPEAGETCFGYSWWSRKVLIHGVHLVVIMPSATAATLVMCATSVFPSRQQMLDGMLGPTWMVPLTLDRYVRSFMLLV